MGIRRFGMAALAACIVSCGGASTGEDGGADAAPHCTADTQCDDTLFCNGVEHCRPGTAGANAMGCLAASAPACAAGRTCDEAHDSCNVDCATAMDSDSDGHAAVACGGDDCDDTDPLRYTGNTEICDAAGHDDDCDLLTLGPDGDGDGLPSDACCNRQADGGQRCGTDCDDTRATVNPTALESCNGEDDDCDGAVDDGVPVDDYVPDCDGDGFGTNDASATPVSGCAAPMAAPTCATVPPGATPGWSTMATDCDDTFAIVHPGATDVCGCTGAPGTTPWDADGDGFVTDACGGDDCDDADDRMFPGGVGVCGCPPPIGVSPGLEVCNGLDDDCNGSTDEGATICGTSAHGSPACAGGMCMPMCDLGYANCLRPIPDTERCDTDTTSDPLNCGMCGRACSGATPNCIMGGCMP